MKKNQEELLKVAYVSKAQGIKGSVFIQPLNPYPDWPQVIKEIFIGENLFTVQRYRPHKKGFIFDLSDCQSREQAEALKTQPVFLPKKLFQKGKGKNFYLAELISFSVEVLGSGKIGCIHSFKSHNFQDFFVIKRDEKESDKRLNKQSSEKTSRESSGKLGKKSNRESPVKSQKELNKKSANESPRKSEQRLDKKSDSELLIPCVDSYIQEIDFANQTIKMKLPENFLQIFSE